MIRRLRTKFICITMAIITVMLTLLLVTQYTSTRSALERASLAALENAVHAPMAGGPPGFADRAPGQPCFVLSMDSRGFRVSGSGYYDLSDTEKLRQIYQAAVADGAGRGVLAQYALRYCRSDGGPEVRYAFTDISGELQTLRALRGSSALIGVLGFFAFLALTVLLARWATRPVELAWEQQRQFVADASHELKTPLTVILTNAELLRERAADQGQRQFSDSIVTMSHQMRGLVEGMLQLARADCGCAAVRQERVDLSGLTEQILLPFEPLYFEAGLVLESAIRPGVAVTGCASQLRQVVEILLDNAMKYSAPGGTVRLELDRQGHQCCLKVTSPGEPLTAAQCRDVFRRFYRVDPARGRSGSYGLGLAIARQIVDDHRGRIWAAGTEQGNVFYVNLPAHQN